MKGQRFAIPVVLPQLLIAIVWVMASGCFGPTCDRTRHGFAYYSGGKTSADGTFYTTNALDEPFLHFPAGRTYRFKHGLGRIPDQWKSELAFAACPFSEEAGKPGGSPECAPIKNNEDTIGVADGAGNEVVIEKPTPDFIEVRNDTCAEFYVRFSAWIYPSSEDETDADAGSPLMSVVDAGE